MNKVILDDGFNSYLVKYYIGCDMKLRLISVYSLLRSREELTTKLLSTRDLNYIFYSIELHTKEVNNELRTTS